MMLRAGLVTALLSGLVLGLSPLESDCVLFDGVVRMQDGSAEVVGFLAPGRKPVGFYLGVDGLEEFSVSVNGVPVKAVEPGATPRTIIRTVDLSDCAHQLRPGTNRLTVSAPGNSGPFRLRCWTSDRAWFVTSLHAHTTYSDGNLSVHELLQEVLADGGRAYAITDHDTLGQCYDTAFHAVGNLEPIRGYEWTTDSGHANLLGIQGANTMPHGPIHDMIEEGSWRGALVQINHPCDLTMEWLHMPLLDPGIDLIEVFNSVTWFPPGKGPTDSDALAVEWWQSLLAGGATIAGVGNSDFHWFAPGIDVLKSCSFVYAPSNHPDTILKYSKLGTVMVFDTPDDSRIWLYADTNNNGDWDLVMGEHVRIPSGSRTIRFRLEVEDADWTDKVYVYDKSGEYFSEILWTGGDFDHEWSRTFSSADRDFYRVELCAELGADYEGVTNPVYVNHPDYELGPADLATAPVTWPDTLYVGAPDTLRFLLRNTSGYSPHRTGLAVALDTALFEITGWQDSGVGIGQAVRRTGAGHGILEWQAGYRWGNRLSPGTTFNYWLAVRPKAMGSSPVLYRSWADDRLFVIDNDPASGFSGPESAYWHRRLIPVEQLTGSAELSVQPKATTLAVPAICRGQLAVNLCVGATGPDRLAVLGATGRLVRELDLASLPVGNHRLVLPVDAAGVYFLRLSTDGATITRRATVVR